MWLVAFLADQLLFHGQTPSVLARNQHQQQRTCGHTILRAYFNCNQTPALANDNVLSTLTDRCDLLWVVVRRYEPKTLQRRPRQRPLKSLENDYGCDYSGFYIEIKLFTCFTGPGRGCLNENFVTIGIINLMQMNYEPTTRARPGATM